jgi:hypothetical protein
MPKTMQNGQPGNYNAVRETRADGEASAFEFTSDGKLLVSMDLNASDIEIGAVEIKDGASDTRATIETAGADASSNTQNNLTVTSRMKGFNGTTWDRLRTAITTATSTLTGILNVFGLGKYNATPPTLTDGQVVVTQMDAAGNTKIMNAAMSDKTNDEVTAFPKKRNLTVISKTTAVTIGGGVASDTILTGLLITAALTGTCVITGFADSDGAAQSITLPAATTAGFKDFGNALNGAGALTITCSNAGDDNLVSAIWVAA